MQDTTKQRRAAFDILRILSIISVVMMHVTASCLPGSYGGGAGDTAVLLYNSVFHYGVPVFVMISGALFLAPERRISLKRLYLHNILRIVAVYLVWSTLYGLYDYSQYRASWKFILWEIVNSRDHLWYLPMIVGIYMLIPILSTWVRNAKVQEIRYFLGAFLVLQIACETIKALPLPELVDFILKLRNIQLICSYVGYFVLGYYVVHIGFSEVVRKRIYIGGILGACLSAAAVVADSLYRGVPTFTLVDSFTIFTFGVSLALFTAVYYRFTEARQSALLTNLGKDTLGIYVCHIGVMELLAKSGFRADSLPVGIGIPVYLIIVLALSTLIAALLRRIPHIGRYIC